MGSNQLFYIVRYLGEFGGVFIGLSLSQVPGRG